MCKEKNMTEFMNLKSDFGFKKVFGDINNKDATIRLLNILFKDRFHVTDIAYHNKEILPTDESGKRILYDVYCTSAVSHESVDDVVYDETACNEKKKNHHFILEMQNVYEPPFEDRLLYYGCKALSEQGKKGWSYDLEAVYTIAITNFNFVHMSKKLSRDIVMKDVEDGEIFNDKFHIILCSLKEVPKKWEDCKTEKEEILYIINNSEDMDRTSAAYRDGRYNSVFEASRTSELRPEECVRYSESLGKLQATERAIKYAAKKAYEKARKESLAEGREEGRAEGRAEGREEERVRNIEAARSFGLTEDQIKAIFG